MENMENERKYQLFRSLPFERFDSQIFLSWIQNHLWTSVQISVVYIILTFSVAVVMKKRRPFVLKWPLVLWNLGLAIFSLLATLRFVPELVYTLFKDGFYGSICDNGLNKEPVMLFWFTIFAFSKLVELGDTVFILLRKQKLITLHWIHHALTVIFAFVTVSSLDATLRWMASMNSLIHTIMYSYYALKALKCNVPKMVPLVITSIQVLQMIVGFIVSALSYYYMLNQEKCQVSSDGATMAIGVYLLYLVLFSNFFYQSYIVQPKLVKAKLG